MNVQEGIFQIVIDLIVYKRMDMNVELLPLIGKHTPFNIYVVN
jgi:hypothetical protein